VRPFCVAPWPKKLDPTDAARIIRTLKHRVALLDDPRAAGAPLKGEHEGYWRWRIGNYRVVAPHRGCPAAHPRCARRAPA
jgi:mRNA-degrading endonuclease RelE of RelBE toxin-antitoxin system